MMIEVKKDYIIRKKDQFEAIHEDLTEYYDMITHFNSKKPVFLSIKIMSGANII